MLYLIGWILGCDVFIKCNIQYNICISHLKTYQGLCRYGCFPHYYKLKSLLFWGKFRLQGDYNLEYTVVGGGEISPFHICLWVWVCVCVCVCVWVCVWVCVGVCVCVFRTETNYPIYTYYPA